MNAAMTRLRALYAKYGSGYPVEDSIAVCGVVLIAAYIIGGH